MTIFPGMETKKSIINCAHCSIPFKPFFRGGRQKYCPDCKDKGRLHTRKETIRQRFESGFVYGKPVQEVVYTRYLKSAESRKIDFQLTLSEFKSFWQKDCHYCGSEIKTAGLDRLDSSIGYTVGNLLPCCTECNLMKRALTKENFIKLCARIAEKHKTPDV